MNDSQNEINKPSPILKNPGKSITFGTIAGLIIGALFGLFIGLTNEPSRENPNPLFEKLTAVVGSRFLGIFLLSAVLFGLLGSGMTLVLVILARVQSKN